MDGWMDGYTLALPDKARAAESLLVAQLLSTHDQVGGLFLPNLLVTLLSFCLSLCLRLVPPPLYRYCPPFTYLL